MLLNVGKSSSWFPTRSLTNRAQELGDIFEPSPVPSSADAIKAKLATIKAYAARLCCTYPPPCFFYMKSRVLVPFKYSVAHTALPVAYLSCRTKESETQQASASLRRAQMVVSSLGEKIKDLTGRMNSKEDYLAGLCLTC